MKKILILLLLPIQLLSQPPWGNGPKPQDWTPPGQLPCWPPPCVSIGDYIPFTLVITAIVIATIKLKRK